MRVNVYAEEITGEVEIVEKDGFNCQIWIRMSGKSSAATVAPSATTKTSTMMDIAENANIQLKELSNETPNILNPVVLRWKSCDTLRDTWQTESPRDFATSWDGLDAAAIGTPTRQLRTALPMTGEPFAVGRLA